MKVFFGSKLDDMLTELRGQAAKWLRLHVLPRIEGRSLIMQTYVTTLSSDQLFESVLEDQVSLDDVPQEQVSEFVRQKCEEQRNKMAERLEKFELRRGILQE